MSAWPRSRWRSRRVAGDGNDVAMWRGRWVRAVVAFGLTGALMGVVPSGAALPAYARCRPTAFVADGLNGSVSTIDVKTRTKKPADITVGSAPFGIALTPDGKTAFVTNRDGGTVSTIGVKTRAKNPNDIAVGPNPSGVAVTPDGRTAFVAHGADVTAPSVPGSNTVSTIDVKTRTKNPQRHHRRHARLLGEGHTRRQDRLRHQLRQRHGVDD